MPLLSSSLQAFTRLGDSLWWVSALMQVPMLLQPAIQLRLLESTFSSGATPYTVCAGPCCSQCSAICCNGSAPDRETMSATKPQESSGSSALRKALQMIKM